MIDSTCWLVRWSHCIRCFLLVFYLGEMIIADSQKKVGDELLVFCGAVFLVLVVGFVGLGGFCVPVPFVAVVLAKRGFTFRGL